MPPSFHRSRYGAGAGHNPADGITPPGAFPLPRRNPDGDHNMADRSTVPLAALQAARRSVKNTGTLPVA